ncbi:hypothetical protein PGAG_00002 [Phaeocystis globosa virus 12T]|nr:hypothetical protein PGAG_00002 [Phaeocystis globosa virus 12T]
MPTGLIQEYRDTVFTEFNSELRPWRVYTTSIYHDPSLVTDLSYLSETSSYDANSNTLNIEASGSDINFYTKDTFKTNFNNAVSIKGILDIEGTLNIPSDGALNLAGDINSQGTSFFKTLKFGDTYTHTTLPIGRGVSGQFLSTNGDGLADWIDVSGSTVPSTFGIVETEKAVVVDGARDISGFRSITMSGQFRGGGGTGGNSYTFDINGNVTGLGSVGCGDISSSGTLGCGDISSIGKIECGEVSITTDGHLRGPALFVIDPAAYGTIGGTVKILGNLEIDGTTTTINSSILDIADYRILLGSNATNDAQTFGAGIEVHSIGGVNNKTFTYEDGGALSDYWESNIDISAEGMTTTDLITQTIKIGETTVTEATLGLLAFATPGIVAPSLGVVVDANKDISGFGNIKAIGFIEAGKDKNTASFLGRAAIGYLGINDMASFAHIDNNSIDDYALMQSATGTTFLHAKAGNHINFSVGTSGQNSMTCHENGFVHVGFLDAAPEAELHVNGSIIGDDITCSAGTDISCVFGQANIGFIGFGNWAGFSHIDVADVDSYGLIQSSAGVTILNAADTKHIEFKIKNVEKMRLTTNGNLGIGTTTPDASLSVVGDISCTTIAAGFNTDVSGIFGFANIGYTEQSGTAGFSHIDHSNFTDFALAQASDGYTILNAKTGFDITFAIGMVMKMNLTSTGLGIGHYFAGYDLDVAGETMLRIMSDTGAAGKLLFGRTGGSGTTTDNRSHAIEAYSAVGPANNYLKFLVHDGAASLSAGRTEVMAMTGDGYVGIGLNNPTKELEVFGDISCSGTIEGLNIKLTNIDVGKDSDVTGYIGRAAIGKVGIGSTAPNSNFWSDQASFAHIDHNTQLNFAIKQDDMGSTNINASTTSVEASEGGRMQFSLGLVEKMRLTNNGLGIGSGTGGQYKDGGTGPDASLSVVGGNIKATDTVRAGESKMGSGVSNSTPTAIFGHESMLSNSNYALCQVKGFATRLNCKLGQTIQFRTNGGTEWARFHNNGTMSIGNTNSTTGHALNVTGSIKASAGFEMGGDLILSGIVDAGNDTDISCNFGKARVGWMNVNDWAGFAHIDSATSTGYSLLHSSDGVTILNAADLKQIEFKINDGEKMRLTSDGRLGIGLSNPTKRLEVNGDISGATSIEAGKDTNTASYLGKARIGDFGQTDWAGFGHMNHNSFQTVALFQSDLGYTMLNAKTDKSIDFCINGFPKMTVNSIGNIGIGLINPTEKLEVIGDISCSGDLHVTGSSSYLGNAMISDIAGDVGFEGGVGFGRMNGSSWTTTTLLSSDSGYTMLNANTDKNISFAINGIPKMILDSTGNIGIGLDNPTEKLEVLGDISCSGDIHVTGGSSFDGKIGIGITNPTKKLEVMGDISCSGGGSFGNAALGTHSGIYAKFHHKDVTGADDYALLQSETGETYLNSKTGQNLSLRINNGPKLTVKASTGDVGIGLTNPTEKLEVMGDISCSGDIHVSGSSSYLGNALISDFDDAELDGVGFGHMNNSTYQTLALFHRFDGGTMLNAKTNKTIDFAINGIRKMIVDSTGNVGIGINNPTEKLAVDGDISASSISCGVGADTTHNFGRAVIGWMGLGLNTIAAFAHQNVADPNNFAFAQTADGVVYINAAGSTGPVGATSIYFMVGLSTKMILNQDGKLGIGTAVPQAHFHINAASAGNTPAGSGTGSNGIFRIQGKYDNNALDIGTITNSGGPGSTGGVGCWLQVADAADQSQKHPLFVQPYGGYFGIGTGTATSLVAPLHVSGWISDTTVSWINLASGSTKTGQNPTINTIPSGVSIYASHGVMSATGFFQGSDDRIKSFETPLTLGLDEIIQLEPKSYLKHPEFLVPIDDETGSTLPIDASGNLYKMEIDGSGNNIKVPMYAESEYGLISQEMLLIPGMELLVTEDKSEDKIKNVNYIGLIPILINGIKELKTINDTQAATIAALDSRLTASLDAQAALIATLTTRLNELGA